MKDYLIIKFIMKRIFVSSVIALTVALVGAASTNAAFTRNLTVGSTGADVSELQAWLISKGYAIPAISSGAAKAGYFGTQTKSAVAAYQKSVGLPSYGFFGPLTIAKVTGGAVGSVAMDTCPSWATCTAKPGVTTPVTTTPGVISTPGIEGTLTVTLNSEPASGTTVREGQMKASIIGAKLEASNSDIDIQRVRVNLGTLASVYTKVYKTLYVTDDAGNVLASMDISSGVPKDGSNYIATIGGFHYIVKKGEKRVLYVKADLYSSIKTADQIARTVQLDANAIRGVDGAGIDQTGPSSAISRSVTSAGAQIDNAALTLTLSNNTPKLGEAIASENSDGGSTDNDLDKLEVLRIDLQADKDSLKLTNAVIAITKTGSGAATASTTAYLYDVTSGSEKLVGSASIITRDAGYSAASLAPFNTIDYVIPADTKSKFVVKVDIRGADGSAASISASATSTSFTTENSGGTAVTPSGSVTGNAQVVRNIGPIFSLVSKEISKTKETNGSNGIATSTLTAKFTVKIKAVGGTIMFGTVASTTGALVNGDVTHLQLYKNSSVATQGAVSTTTSFQVPTSGVVTSGLTNSFTVADGGEVEVPITYTFLSRTNAGVDTSTLGNYSVNLQGLSWVGPSGVASSTFMSGITDWRTAEIPFP